MVDVANIANARLEAGELALGNGGAVESLEHGDE